ncbi:fumarylacetoacetase [Stutzerimonas xanthomarina]|uniref:fumarylacetoacetase n=2 Tax=Stutzerimonas xanthomarina TaxID=271420 RepID=A0A1M5MEQ5_9GAMM|nr:fumarylacetoacetase [Stutzerimonas xanthomarina]MCP9338956.1 fumarylacetoacetase [Stutzerimonas xanthomarina]SEH90352.1 fumarylacetoacetate hydrolase [Stutzerimonas xanthomarina]SHG75701.1 fumarylacetoacetate hydrolase [Stutzerimonas xanthomarina DSM 18231]
MTVHNEQRSWVESANGHSDFPLANLPLGVFSRDGDQPRGGVAIGDYILDLRAACEAGVFDGQALEAAKAASVSSLNAFFALGASARKALRGALMDLLAEDSAQRERLQGMGESLLQPMNRCQMHLPAKVGDYTDFYVGIHHANNVGLLFRPDNPLLPNYKYVPIGYHGRASTVDVSGSTVKRPNGQTMPPGATEPSFGPSKRLDHELELGIWIGQGNARGESIPIGEASSHVAGFCLLNDWSARDLQAWEYQPLGPFLSKSFATSVSPWVITPEALEPFRCAQPARAEGDPQPLPYLFDQQDQQQGALDIELEVLLLTETMRDKGQPAQRIALSSTKNMYWTVAQMVAHHSVNGCSLQPGDLFGSGTLSGSSADSLGSLLEITQGGKLPLELPSGETRTFLQDGDEIILKARCRRDGQASIGFGECRGRVMPA